MIYSWILGLQVAMSVQEYGIHASFVIVGFCYSLDLLHKSFNAKDVPVYNISALATVP